MLELDIFELETLLVHLEMWDTIFGRTPVRDKLMNKIKDCLNAED